MIYDVGRPLFQPDRILKHATQTDLSTLVCPPIPMHLSPSHQAALHIQQRAIARLLDWATIPLPCSIPEPSDAIKPAITTALNILNWDSAKLDYLELIFDRVHLTEHQQAQHYLPLQAIANDHPSIPYPLNHPSEVGDRHPYQTALQTAVQFLPENWDNLPFLSVFLEKFAHCVSFGQTDTALLDVTRTVAAIASALTTAEATDQLTLIGVNLSGIQNFIYTISSDGALKSLRARSFYLELVTEEIAQQFLHICDLPRTSIIYIGGGNLYLIAPSDPDKLEQIRQRFNHWLLKEFQGKIFISMDAQPFAPTTVTSKEFCTCWNELIKKLNTHKTARFRHQMNDLLATRESYETCRVCHRDDLDNLKPLNDPDSPLACPTCRHMFKLGGELFKVDSIVRSHQENSHALYSIPFRFSDPTTPDVYYHLFHGDRPITDTPESVFLINNWDLENYQFKHFQGKAVLLLLGNYGKKVSDKAGRETGFMTAAEFAKESSGVDRVGYLRMDVDRLGQIFANGLGDHYSLPRLAGLSRQMSYFFKTYLNELAEERSQNFLQHQERFNFRRLTTGDRKNLLFIYAGGDDLFVSGAWNEVTEFALDVYQSFRAYTGNNPDITLSAGMTIAGNKFPLYQAAESSGEAEQTAKGNGRNSLCTFDQVHKWDNWLGHPVLPDAPEQYTGLSQNEAPPLLGVLPFVQHFLDTGQSQDPNEAKIPKSFIRNLLVVAQLREQKIREQEITQAKEQYPQQMQDVIYYLHLPKLAYAFSRLPPKLRNADQFQPVRTSLLSPFNSPYFRAIATWTDLLTRSSNP